MNRPKTEKERKEQERFFALQASRPAAPQVSEPDGRTPAWVTGTHAPCDRLVVKLQARIERLESALREDAAGEPVAVLLRIAASALIISGGSLVDRLTLASDAIDAALATEDAEKGRESR